MAWFRRNWRWLLAVSVCSIGAIALIILYVLKKRDEVAKLKSELALFATAQKVAGLEADRTARAKELAADTAASAALDKEIAAAKKAAVAQVKAVDGMNDDDIAAEFRRLGY